MNLKETVVLVGHHLEFLVPSLDGNYDVVRSWRDLDEALLAEAKVMIVSGDRPLDFVLIEAMPALEYIACVSRGYDGIDLHWVTDRGLEFSHAEHVNDEDVADHALGCIIMHRRTLREADKTLRGGGWDTGVVAANRSLRGAALGIVGLGSIGQALAHRAGTLRMSVAWWGPRSKDVIWPRKPSLVQLARSVDYLVVTARAGDNDHMISKEVIDALGPDGMLVNVARGRLVDEGALISALREGRLGAAALDVFEQEPTLASRWTDVPNTLLTPHIAGKTQDAFETIATQLGANLSRFFSGQALTMSDPPLLTVT